MPAHCQLQSHAAAHPPRVLALCQAAARHQPGGGCRRELHLPQPLPHRVCAVVHAQGRRWAAQSARAAAVGLPRIQHVPAARLHHGRGAEGGAAARHHAAARLRGCDGGADRRVPLAHGVCVRGRRDDARHRDAPAAAQPAVHQHARGAAPRRRRQRVTVPARLWRRVCAGHTAASGAGQAAGALQAAAPQPARAGQQLLAQLAGRLLWPAGRAHQQRVPAVQVRAARHHAGGRHGGGLQAFPVPAAALGGGQPRAVRRAGQHVQEHHHPRGPPV
mmetsp:Transcript_45946/g.115669  ORF Transcript_45946/g.115669 Transcript_45946/m.115669 type:complete len:275 (-) Transcript_45946:1638-2462(-)